MHLIQKCKHGVIGSQCRCPLPNKTVSIVSCNAVGCDKGNPLTDDQITAIAYEQIFESAESMLQDWIDEEGDYSREDYLKIRKQAFKLIEELREKYQ